MLEDNILDTTYEMKTTTASLGYGSGRRKLIRDRTSPTLRGNNVRYQVENMTSKQLEEANATIEEFPDVNTVVERNGNTDSNKREIIDDILLNKSEN